MSDGYQAMLPLSMDSAAGSDQRSTAVHGDNGMVYTRHWVVQLMLDLSGYSAAANLANSFSVEPCVGDGAFVTEMARRLAKSCECYGREIEESYDALIAYELDANSVKRSRDAVATVLQESGVSGATATSLAAKWIRHGDYLLDAPTLPKADFIIGNPPYVRVEMIDPAVATIYRRLYRSMVGRADLYIPFFEAALNQLKPGGICAFICADRWMYNQYGAELRRIVTNGFAVEAVMEMHNTDPFESAVSAYPAITLIRRAPQHRVFVASVGSEAALAPSERLSQSITHAVATGEPTHYATGFEESIVIDEWFSGSDPWPVGSPQKLGMLRYLEQNFEPLESDETGTRVGIGVATGADKVFITDDVSAVEQSRLLPLATAHDLKSGSFNWTGRYLINPWDDRGLVKLDRYPELSEYLTSHYQVLSGRHVARKQPAQWYKTIDRVNPDLTSRPKLLIGDIRNRLRPILEPGGTYPHHNLYYITSDRWNLEVLGGLLMTDIALLFVECYGVRMRGNYFRFQSQYLRRIRVPTPDQIDSHSSEALIQAYRSNDTALANSVAKSIYKVHQMREGSEPIERK